MSGKPIWESRFAGLEEIISFEKQWVESVLARKIIETQGKEVNTQEFWKLVGKYEALSSIQENMGFFKTTNCF